MESQPQDPEFRINPENFLTHGYIYQCSAKFSKFACAGILLAQNKNDDGLYNWANSTFPIQKQANFTIFMGHLNFDGPNNPIYAP